MKRTHYAGLVTEAELGQTITLQGWVNKRRDLGSLIFIDLRDREGIVQIVFDDSISKDMFEVAESLRSEYVITVEGEVILRDENLVNPQLKTGKIEVKATSLTIISKAETPPFAIDQNDDISDEVRLKHRYIDLRRPKIQSTLMMRHQITSAIRRFMDQDGFIDIETPVLNKSTPEGARDYLVPSRVHDGSFYALPQSPQMFKQLLMVSGFDKYYQIVKCFRDEDLRADRQPEFTQLDVEMSFVDEEDVMDFNERLLTYVMKEVKGLDIKTPFDRMTYDEAMAQYGIDKPDTRFGMTLQDLTEFAKTTDFKVFKETAENGGLVNAIVVKDSADQYSRKDIDKLTDFVKLYKAKGLAWMKVDEGQLTGPIAKFFDEAEQQKLLTQLDATHNDLLLFVADKKEVTQTSLGQLRNHIAKQLDLIDQEQFNFLWVTDWPLLEYDEETERYHAAHHPFTSPKDSDVELLQTAPEKAYAKAYDVVLNGFELGGGSIRIHDGKVQQQMFKALGFSDEERDAQFGFLIDAFKYGTPPHGGIALGLDRLVMLLSGRSNLRDTIAFPKTANASCLMTNAPSEVSAEQLEELGIQLKDRTDK